MLAKIFIILLSLQVFNLKAYSQEGQTKQETPLQELQIEIIKSLIKTLDSDK